jgi:predicted dehydrogenase
MTGTGAVRWGIIGTANIARAAFLPGLRRAGGVARASTGSSGP